MSKEILDEQIELLSSSAKFLEQGIKVLDETLADLAETDVRGRKNEADHRIHIKQKARFELKECTRLIKAVASHSE